MTTNAPELLTRANFDQTRIAVHRSRRKEWRTLTNYSVGLGMVFFLFLRAADFNVAGASRLVVVATVLLAYLGGFGLLAWHAQRRLRAARPACPHCRMVLTGESERVASATGKCDGCRNWVFVEEDREV